MHFSLLSHYLNDYLPLVISVSLMVTALILRAIWFRDETTSPTFQLKKEFAAFLSSNDYSVDDLVEGCMQIPFPKLLSFVYEQSTQIQIDTPTFHRLQEFFFHPKICSRLPVYYLENPLLYTADVIQLADALADERFSPILSSFLDQKTLPDHIRLDLLNALLRLDCHKGWAGLLRFPQQATSFSSLRTRYFENLLTVYQTHFPNVPKEISLSDTDISFFQSLLFDEQDSVAEIAILIGSAFSFPSLETILEDRLAIKKNSYEIMNACLQGLKTLNTTASAKVIHRFIGSHPSSEASQLIQLAFKTLSEMGSIGMPYIVLLSQSRDPFIQVLASSYLHQEG